MEKLWFGAKSQGVIGIATNATLKEHAYVELKKLILTGDVVPGQALSERVLVDMLGMSRTPIRAAMEKLHSEGLLNYTPNKGIVVTELSLQRAIDVYDVRIPLEVYIVRKLCDRAWTEENKAPIEENLRKQDEYSKAREFEQFTLADMDYHRLLALQYGNMEVLSILDRLHDVASQIAFKVLKKDQQRIRVSYEDHVNIFHAILRSDGDSAQEAMVKHLQLGSKIFSY